MTKQYSTIEMGDALINCMQDPQALLSKALENKSIRDFKIALDMEADPTRNDAISNLSIFEKALQTYGLSQFVEEAISRGCKCDYTNRRTNKSPINYAADSRDPQNIAALLTIKNIPVDAKYANLTPLNSLSKNITNENYNDVFKCIEHLIKYGANPNIPDQREFTPILYIINNKKIDNDKKRELIQFLFDNSNIDLDTFRDGEARERLQSRYPDIQLPNEFNVNITYDTLVMLIQNGNEEKFMKNFQEYQLNLSEKDNLHNSIQEDNIGLLIEAIKWGKHQSFDTIMNTGVNINLIKNNNSPIKIACINGNFRALQKLLDDDELKLRKYDNLLITTIQNMDEPSYNNFCNYHTCFYTLLESNKIDINETDESGSAALHYAVKYKNEQAIKELLRRGAYLGTKSAFNDFPISEINPDMLENYFDSCVTTNGLKPGDDNFEIIINYSNLIPLDEPKSVKSEMAPIELIADTKEFRHLLKHPLITSFLFLKWHRLSIFFYVNFILYAIFCASLVAYILLKFNNSEDNTGIAICQVISFIGLIYMILREFVQIIFSPKNYAKKITNYFEIILITFTILTLTLSNYDNDGQRIIAVITILLASIELCLSVGSLPVVTISTHMLMLREVSKSFLKGFALYSIFVITFSLCFYILFGKPGPLVENSVGDSEEGQFNKFENPFTAIIKTIVMLTGEFDAGDIAFNSFYSYLVFLLFVFFMSIVLFNLLNGLAVSDTQAIKSQAELNGYIVRTTILSNFEKALTGRHGSTSFLVNQQPFQSIFKNLTNLFPDYISGRYISILPNSGNKVLIPIANSPIQMEPMYSKTNGTSALLALKKSNDDSKDEQKKLLDYPVKFLPCCCPCTRNKCSKMEYRTVKQALIIIDKKYQSNKQKTKIQNDEDRIKNIENKIDKILTLLESNSIN